MATEHPEQQASRSEPGYQRSQRQASPESSHPAAFEQGEAAQPGASADMAADARRHAQYSYAAGYADWEEDEYGIDEEASSWVARMRPDDRQLTQALGWLSIGLGLAQLVAPRALGRAIGVGEHPGIMRALGMRELANGLGLLSERAPGVWAWSRAAGDAMDLALLGAASRAPQADPRRIAAAATFVLGATALDVHAGRRLTQSQSADQPLVEVSETIIVNATPQALYAFWKNVENLPLFMRHLESVSTTGETTSHWIATAPGGTSVEWDAEIVDDQPDRRIGWRTLPDSQVTHEGMVSFEPAVGDRGTVVRVEMLYRPPAGKLGAQIARLLGEEPRLQVKEDLRRLKQLLETGEVATTLGQPSGARSLLGRLALGRRLQ